MIDEIGFFSAVEPSQLHDGEKLSNGIYTPAKKVDGKKFETLPADLRTVFLNTHSEQHFEPCIPRSLCKTYPMEAEIPVLRD
jgi:hypothetical protein